MICFVYIYIYINNNQLKYYNYNMIERQDIARARQHWQENKDAKQALELFPRRCIAEHQILSSFVKTGHNKDCYRAFMTVC